jgi:hypothetical protein
MSDDSLEHELRAALRQRADLAPTLEPPARTAYARRLDSGRLRRTAAVAAALIGVAGVAWLVGGTREQSITAAGDRAASSREQDGPSSGPYLAFDEPYRRLEDEPCRKATNATGSSDRLDTFGTSYFESPIMFVQTLKQRGASDAGLISAGEGDPTVLRGAPGFASKNSGPNAGWALSASLPGGDAIYVTVLGLDLNDATAIVDALEPRADGGWELGSNARGFRRLGPSEPASGCGYSGQGNGFSVHMYVDRFDRRLQDRAATPLGPLERVALQDLPAVVGDYGIADHWVLAEPAPGLTLEVRSSGSRERLLTLLSRARFVDSRDAAVMPGAHADSPSGTAVPTPED